MKNNMFLILSVALLIASCSYDGIYRSEFNKECVYKKRGDCANSANQIAYKNSTNEYRLGFIEYDDQGQLRNRKQQDSVIDRYSAISKKQDVIVITFVHGWHQNAKSENENVLQFRQFLASLSEKEAQYSKKHQRARRPVLGVFIGWRGDSSDNKYIKNLTFWERKNTANEIGQQGITEALLKLESLVNEYKLNGNQLVLIGHSLGASIAYSSIQKILADRYLYPRKKPKRQQPVDGFGNLVVLMNPAFEALHFSDLWELSQDKCRSYPVGQLPKLLILTSETDYATKIAFPFGRAFSTLFENYSAMQRHECKGVGVKNIKEVNINQWQADIMAVGHFKPYQTHRLDLSKKSAVTTFDLQHAYDDWSATDTNQADVYSVVTLINKGRTTPRNPYMNVEVSKELMNGHNDIWGDKITTFISELISVSIMPPLKTKKNQKK